MNDPALHRVVERWMAEIRAVSSAEQRPAWLTERMRWARSSAEAPAPEKTDAS